MTLSDVQLIGWCPPPKRDFLVDWITQRKSVVIVEIGVYGGASLIPMAWACREWHSKCVGIDPWDPKACLEGMKSSANRDWWRRLSHLGLVEERCREAIGQLGLTNIELWKGTSDQYRNSFRDSEIDVLSIDGNHGAQALVDGKNYLGKVKIGGLIACDDVWWTEGKVFTVRVLVDWLIENGCKTLGVIEGCEMLEKER